MPSTVSQDALVDLVVCTRMTLMDPNFHEKATDERIEQVKESLEEAEDELADSIDPDEFMHENLKPVEVNR